MRSYLLTFARLGDHYRYHEQYEKSGIPTFYPWMTEHKSVQYGGFKIKAFDNPHGDTTSYGFYIEHENFGKLIFVTDAELVKYSFKSMKVNHILCECNYTLSMVNPDAPNFKHKIEGHMADKTCIEFVRHNKSASLRNVVLLHDGIGTTDKEGTVNIIRSIVDADVFCGFAYSGMEIELKKEVL